MTLSPLHTDHARIKDAADRDVVLRGIAIGGWLNMENFISGFAGAEHEFRDAMRHRLTTEAYEAFFSEYERAFFSRADVDYLADLGFNSVRIPINYRLLEDDSAPFEIKHDALARLDDIVTALGDKDIYTILDLHAVPQYQNQDWHSDNATHIAGFWESERSQDRVIWLWEYLAQHYKANPNIAGFNLLNEPASEDDEALTSIYRRLYNHIRRIDDDRVLFLDGNRYSSEFTIFEPYLSEWHDVVFAVHDYALPGIAQTAAYPGITRGRYFDASVVEQTFQRRAAFMLEHDVPIWVGEFGPIYGAPHATELKLAVLRDQLDTYRRFDVSWSLWTYKDIGLQGLVFVPEDAPYRRLIKPVTDIKQRLGADSWGGGYGAIGDVIKPILNLLATEFPEWDPYPWGQEPRVKRLLQNILLSEPINERLASLFDGADVDELRALARSFGFERCVPRPEVAAMLRSHLRPDSI